MIRLSNIFVHNNELWNLGQGNRGKDPGPEDLALVIPGGDLVCCNLNGARSDGEHQEKVKRKD